MPPQPPGSQSESSSHPALSQSPMPQERGESRVIPSSPTVHKVDEVAHPHRSCFLSNEHKLSCNRNHEEEAVFLIDWVTFGQG